MPLIAAGALAGLGFAGQAIESGKAANATQSAAQAQQARADQAMGFAAPTAGELQNLSRQNTMAQQAMQYAQAQTQLAAQTVNTAFQQQNQIMNGQIPGYLQPLQKQLQIASQQNQSRVNGVMGNGASSSSAGMMANSIFGQNAAMTTMQTQQQALGTLGAVGANAVGVANQSMGMASNLNEGAFGMSNTLQSRQANAALGTANYQGSQFTGQAMDARSMASMFGSIGGIGTGVAMNQAFGTAGSMGSRGSGNTMAGYQSSQSFSEGANNQINQIGQMGMSPSQYHL